MLKKQKSSRKNEYENELQLQKYRPQRRNLYAEIIIYMNMTVMNMNYRQLIFLSVFQKEMNEE